MAQLPASRAFQEQLLPRLRASHPLQALLHVLAFEFCSPNLRDKEQLGCRRGRRAGANGVTVVQVSRSGSGRRQSAGINPEQRFSLMWFQHPMGDLLL